jgi:hypothetical protein
MLDIKALGFLVILLMTGALLGQPVHAQAYAYAYAKSPDHPKTWVDGATRSRQSLRWDAARHMLFGDVTYSTAYFADGPHPTQEDDFSLTFPTVHFDPSSNKFTANGVVVATLRHGLFGAEVALDPKVELSIHRHHGVIHGALIAADQD